MPSVWIGFLNSFLHELGGSGSLLHWQNPHLPPHPSLTIPGWGPSQALTSPANKVTFCAWGRRSGKTSSGLKKAMVLRSAAGWGLGREQDKSGQ